MNKMQMAHEYAMLHMSNPQYKDVDDLEMVQWAFDYADAMQAEADKRSKEEAEEWQPDWSVAPEWANWWYKTSDNKYQWCSRKPYQDGCNWFVNCSDIYTLDVSPSFNYQGSWQNSLRKRPK